MASLTLGSLNFRTTASVNDPETIRGLLDAMGEAGIRPELEIFDSGMAYMAADLLDRGLLTEPLYANVLLGSLGTAPARAADLAHLTGLLPEGTVWAAAGIGAFQLPMNALALFMGGHVRTGLEDNPYFDHGRRSDASNVQLVERVVALAGVAQRPVATVAETRTLLGLAHASQSVDGK
jgi:3-keto-5-aminohexanoate cleavage enzyme